jgi:hypothetical protein
MQVEGVGPIVVAETQRLVVDRYAGQQGGMMSRRALQAGSLVLVLSVLAVDTALAGFAGTDVFVPSVGRRPGAAGSQWYTTVWINNPSTATANVTISFLERNVANPTPQSFSESIPAGDTRRYANALWDLFMVEKYGALRITSSTPVLVTCRLFNLPSGGEEKDTQGQDHAAIPASFAIGSGQSTQLLGVYQTSPKDASQFRYNFGWVETAGGSAEVRAIAYTDTGLEVVHKDYPTTGPYEPRFYPIEDLLGTFGTTNARIELRVTSGSGKIIGVGSGVSNRSNDATSFEMSFRDELLGGGSSAVVSHDASLIGDGSIGAPLGIADGGVTGGKIGAGAVTPAKINFSGAMVDQVLKFDGVKVDWADDNAGGVTLPYSGSVFAKGDAFAITNTTGHYGALAGSHGVAGSTTVPTRSGVYGEANVGNAYGVYGTNKANGAYGFLGGYDGVVGYSALENKSGVFGDAGDSKSFGVYGRSMSGTYGYLGGAWNGVYGYSPSSGGGAGVMGDGSVDGVGVYGKVSGGSGIAVLGSNTRLGNQGGLGAMILDFAGRRVSVGVFGRQSRDSLAGEIQYASYFDGEVGVVGHLGIAGNLTKSSGSFKIDHPIEPADKYLYHSFVESPDMMNVYNGNVLLDGSGEAWIELPEWFEALNRDFRYQLTAIGAPGPNLFVADEVHGNRFKIAGGAPGMKVSWQLTGIRQDAWANAHRIPVEESKSLAERGYYLHPELFGQPAERQLGAVTVATPEK